MRCFRTSAPDHWTQPRAHRDASQRRHTHGPIVPMHGTTNAPRDRLAIAAIGAALATALAALLATAG